MSRNDIFSTSWAAIPPTDLARRRTTPGWRRPRTDPLRPRGGSLDSSSDSSASSLFSSGSNPSLAASLPSPSPLAPIDVRFSPRPDLELGCGRFSKVYLAAHRTSPGKHWRVCVVKRLEPDHDSQALGLREAWFLRQLCDGPHPGQEFIARLLSLQLQDEVRASWD